MATIQGIYVALFARPADPLGLAHFEDVTQGGRDLTRIGDLTSTEEYVERFAGQSNEEIITSIYRSLFNRDPDAAGLAFFLDLMDSGVQSVNTITINIMQGARGDDIATLLAKIEAADKFTARVDTPHGIEAYHYGFTFQGDYSVEVAREYLAGVTASTPASDAAADAAVLRLFPQVEIELASANPSTGQTTQVTFTFTEPVVGFTLEDVAVKGGTLSNLQLVEGNANAYTATFVAASSAQAGSFSIAFNSYEDRDGIDGWPGSLSFNVGTSGGGVVTPPVASGQVAASIDEATAQQFAPTLLRAAAVSDNHISAGTLDYDLAPNATDVTFTWLDTVKTDLPGDAVLMSGGRPVTWSLSDDGTVLSGTVIDGNVVRPIIEVSLGGADNRDYAVTLRSGIDHPGEGLSGASDQIELTFTYVVESSAGTIDSTLSISILDSAPEMRDGYLFVEAPINAGARVAEPTPPLTENLFAGADAMVTTQSKDSGGGSLAIRIDGVSYSFDYATGNITTMTDAPTFDDDTHVLSVVTEKGGTFYIDFDDGSYSYVAFSPLFEGYHETVVVSLTDADGDTASAALNITVSPQAIVEL